MSNLPREFHWPNGARLALSIVVNVEEGAEMNIRDGDPGPEPVDELAPPPRKPVRVRSNETNYRYGIRRGAERVFGLLRERNIKCTATCAALALERAPRITRQIIDDDHEVCCHGYRWVHQFRMNEKEEQDFIRRGWQSIESTIGTRPRGWLSRYLTTDITRRLLVEEGFTYHMDDYSDDIPFWDYVTMADGSRQPLLTLPYAVDSNDMKMWVAPSLTPDDWLKYALDTFDWLLREANAEGARMMSLGLHLRIIGRPGRIGALRAFLDHVAAREDVWIARRQDIAQAFMNAVPHDIQHQADNRAVSPGE